MKTPEQAAWDKKLSETWNGLPSYSDDRWKQREAHRLMIVHHGRRPAGVPLKVRLVSWWVGRKLTGVESTEVNMSPFLKKAIVSLLYGAGALGAVVSVAITDGEINGAEWGAIFSAFATAAWGKFSSNTTTFAPSRKGETIAGPE